MFLVSANSSCLSLPLVLSQAATHVWESSQRKIAPNGGVMRTSILGIHDFKSIEKVVENTVNICKVTHADTR